MGVKGGMDKYSRLFDLKRYLDEDEEICFSINGDEDNNAFFLPEPICSRIICIGKAYKLHYIPMIDIYGEIKLNKKQVSSLIEELLFINSIVSDKIIEHFVPSLVELLENITHKQNDNVLWITGN